MKIGFHTNGLSLRGTEVALYDYANQNQQFLGNESVVFYRKNNPVNKGIHEKFLAQFKLCPYENQAELNRLVEREKVDMTYFIKPGDRDDSICDSSPVLIHAVFPTKVKEFHGDKFAFVSEWLSKEYSNNRIPFVPHMIELPQVEGDLRSEFNIPESATVLAWYGGSDSFNLEFVKKEIIAAVEKRPDLYFLFMNMEPFAQHERIIFLPGTADSIYKVRFINTSDGMIHARGIGESFGIACGEFSIKGKPVISYALSPQRSHMEILGDKGIFYKGKRDLAEIFQNFDRQVQHQKNWDAYSAYFSPSIVMRKFDEVFIKGKNLSDITISTIDKMVMKKYGFTRKMRHHQKKLYR